MGKMGYTVGNATYAAIDYTKCWQLSILQDVISQSAVHSNATYTIVMNLSAQMRQIKCFGILANGILTVYY